jgi:hypothetical protein
VVVARKKARVERVGASGGGACVRDRCQRLEFGVAGRVGDGHDAVFARGVVRQERFVVRAGAGQVGGWVGRVASRRGSGVLPAIDSTPSNTRTIFSRSRGFFLFRPASSCLRMVSWSK